MPRIRTRDSWRGMPGIGPLTTDWTNRYSAALKPMPSAKIPIIVAVATGARAKWRAA